MPDLSLPVPHGAGSFYTIPSDDWTAMNNRASVVIADAPIAKIISKEIPNYDQLLAACRAWVKDGFPGILEQAGEVATLATTVSGHLQSLESTVAGLPPSAPVPESARFIVGVNLEAAGDGASDLAAKTEALAPVVQDFVQQNLAADKAITSAVPKDWVTASETLATLEDGLTTVRDDWAAVADDLASIAARADSLTTAQLKVADYTEAVAAWQGLNTDAAAFLEHDSTTND